MIPFKQFQQLDEKLITLNKTAYPKSDNIVILAGGAGSGKGFVRKNLLGIEGKVLDVDRTKELAIQSKDLAKKIKKETGHDISKFDLRKPDDVSTLHTILSDVYPVNTMKEAALFRSIIATPVGKKPNLIFDMTMKDIESFINKTNLITELGYDKKNVHIVWVVNDIAVAMKQNAGRSRVVPEKILLGTHEGTSKTMAELLKNSSFLTKRLDGDIWFAFNKVTVDISTVSSKNSGKYVKDAFLVKVKSAGKKPLAVNKLESTVLDKIKSYVPNSEVWD